MQRSQLTTAVLFGLMSSVLLAGCTRKEPEQVAAPAATKAAAPAPAASAAYPTRVYFGDTHLHTAMSLDAGVIRQPPRRRGRLPLRPRRGSDGLQRTEGETIAAARFPGGRGPLRQHGICHRPDRREAGAARRSDWQEVVRHDEGRRGQRGGVGTHRQFLARHDSRRSCMYTPGTRGLWRGMEVDRSTLRRNTTSPASSRPSSATSGLRRCRRATTCIAVVIYRDGADKASQTEPFTTYPPAGSTMPEDLWKVLQAYEGKTGGQVLAIAHNGNLSNGMMFPWDVNPAGKKPLTREYAETRISWEPLYEVTQIKGDGEAHPFLSQERRVRRLRNLGQGQPQSERAQEERDAARRVRAHGAADRSAARAETRRESVQVRHDRFNRCAYIARHRR